MLGSDMAAMTSAGEADRALCDFAADPAIADDAEGLAQDLAVR